VATDSGGADVRDPSDEGENCDEAATEAPDGAALDQQTDPAQSVSQPAGGPEPSGDTLSGDAEPADSDGSSGDTASSDSPDPGPATDDSPDRSGGDDSGTGKPEHDPTGDAASATEGVGETANGDDDEQSETDDDPLSGDAFPDSEDLPGIDPEDGLDDLLADDASEDETTDR